MKLHVIDHHPAAWFLLDEGKPGAENHYYLDVNCGEGAAGFSLLVQLSDAEREEYRALGRVFIEYLAAKIAYRWRDFSERDLESRLQAEVSDAVARFRSQPGSDEKNPPPLERD
ncbi:hypothetical protein [Longimicrobium sp.]|uniref:hypothetical protein n=1 Tax=Longimicrobium sp. TaxID=2029185 RepID=UPI002D0EB550|nr:hypothetical protein [Longimicrobium sp.]HSU17691.1 hypothetical protein [Longimicrobium sp.]